MSVKHRRHRHFYHLALVLCCLAALLISCAPPTAQVVSIAPLVKGETLYIYRGLLSAVSAVAWSPDGKRIAAASFDKTVQVWDAASGRHLLTYKGHTASVIALAWSPDGTRIASAGLDKTVQVWDATTGRRCSRKGVPIIFG